MDDYLGAIRLFPWDFEMEGWLKCQGQVLSIEQNEALFSLMGTKFGGDGCRNFMLPNLPDIQTNEGALSYYIAMQGIYPSRA